MTSWCLAVPSTGPIPLRLSRGMLAKRKSKYLAVPSTGPIPLRRPWCSGNDRFRVSCSTLYRAYPIATISNHSILLHQYILQYPLPGLSHCDPSRAYLAHQRVAPCSTLYRAYPIATTVRECRCDRPKNACSTLYRAYPIATGLFHSAGHKATSSCSTLYRAYPIATPFTLSLALFPSRSCSTLYRAYPIATLQVDAFDLALEALAVPSTGPIPLRLLATCSTVSRWPMLAVPSTGPIPLRLSSSLASWGTEIAVTCR